MSDVYSCARLVVRSLPSKEVSESQENRQNTSIGSGWPVSVSSYGLRSTIMLGLFLSYPCGSDRASAGTILGRRGAVVPKRNMESVVLRLRTALLEAYGIASNA
jgi:hypothetical protein